MMILPLSSPHLQVPQVKRGGCFSHVIIFIAIHIIVDCVKRRRHEWPIEKSVEGNVPSHRTIRNFWVTSQTNDEKEEGGGGNWIAQQEMKRYLH